jgi:hypothetical protein
MRSVAERITLWNAVNHTGIETAIIIAAVASAALAAAGTIAAGQAQKDAGRAQQRAAEYQNMLKGAEADNLESKAGQERAVAQQQAMAEAQRGRMVGSRAQAITAASGAGALDPTVNDIMAGIDQESELRQRSALYTGEEKARGLEYGAVLERAGGQGTLWAGEVARQQGEAALQRSYLSAGSQVAGAAANYGMSTYRTPSPTQISSAGGVSRYATAFPYSDFAAYR